MPSIRELRDRKQRESFTGRQAELNTFRRLLTADESEYAILHIYGVGGIGKSSVLRQFRRIAQELGYPVAIVDMQVHFGVDEILRSVREQIGRGGGRAFSEFDKSLEMFNDVKSKLQGTVGSLASGVVSGLREGVPLGLGALAVDTIGEEQVKAWLYRHLPRANADLYLHGDRVLTADLVVGLNRMAEHNSNKLVVMFDTFEQSSQVQDDWLRDILLDSDLSSKAFIVVAGRDPLDNRWHEWRSVLLSRQLPPFTEKEAREYLTRRGVTDPALIEALLGSTERLPWALALVTDISAVHEMSTADLISRRHAIGDKLVERFVSQVQDDRELRELVDVCAVVRTFDYDVVRAVWGRDTIDEPMRQLRRYSFVHVRADGRWSLNQVVREFLDQGLRRRSSKRWAELNRRALDFYQESAATRPHYSSEWNWLTLESLYHQLQLDEDEGIACLGSLFDEAKRFSRYDFCSELLNNVQDVRLTHAHSKQWLTFYQGVIIRVVNRVAWDETHSINQKLFQASDLPPALRARITADLGRYHYLISGEYEQAIEMLNQSLALRRELQDKQGQAHVLSHLAVAHATAGDCEQGRACGQACIQLARQLNAPYHLGWGYFSMGVVESRANNYPTAFGHFEQSLNTFEASGQEFEPGVVHYHMGRAARATGDLDTALAHLESNLGLMQKYDKQFLAARTMVDICELYLVQKDGARLSRQATKAQKIILEQNNDALLAQLRLIQAEDLLRQTRDDALGQVQDEASGQIRDSTDDTLYETIIEFYLDALLAAAKTPQLMLDDVVKKIEAQLGELDKKKDGALAQLISQSLIAGIDQALEGALARHGQLVVVPASAHSPLRALKLARRWAKMDRQRLKSTRRAEKGAT